MTAHIICVLPTSYLTVHLLSNYPLTVCVAHLTTTWLFLFYCMTNLLLWQLGLRSYSYRKFLIKYKIHTIMSYNDFSFDSHLISSDVTILHRADARSCTPCLAHVLNLTSVFSLSFKDDYLIAKITRTVKFLIWITYTWTLGGGGQNMTLMLVSVYRNVLIYLYSLKNTIISSND